MFREELSKFLNTEKAKTSDYIQILELEKK